jgi:hypothetical protein
MELMMILILLYQVTMPAVDNAKFTFGTVNEHIVRMNTQNGSFELCDENFKCESIK